MKHSSQSDMRRYSCKSETSITPTRVPCNGGAQCAMTKKTFEAVQEVRSLYKQVVNVMQQYDDVKLILIQLTKHFQHFEKNLTDQLDIYTTENNQLRNQNTQLQSKIQKFTVQNDDLQKKLKQMQYSLAQSPNYSPVKNRNSISIELITKKPVRNLSVHQSRDDKENMDYKVEKKPSFKFKPLRLIN